MGKKFAISRPSSIPLRPTSLSMTYERKKKFRWTHLPLRQPTTPFASDGDRAHWEPSVDTQDVLWDTIDGHMAMETLQELDVPYRDVVVMRYIDGLSPQEIAEILEETPNVVSVRIHRALEKLRTLILKKNNNNTQL